MKAFTERNYLLIFKVEKTIFCNVSAVVVVMSNEKNFFVTELFLLQSYQDWMEWDRCVLMVMIVEFDVINNHDWIS